MASDKEFCKMFLINKMDKNWQETTQLIWIIYLLNIQNYVIDALINWLVSQYVSQPVS